MLHSPIAAEPVRRDRAARDLVRSWRALAGGRSARDDERPTLVACSGGADSAALAITLSLVPAARITIAHVLHDMRPAREARADRDAVRTLAHRLGRPFVEASISVSAPRANTESVARARRYRALARLALEHACPYVAVGHQGDDLLETMLMRLLRGAGTRGLAAIAPARPLGPSATLVRPMLALSRLDSERLCRAAAWQWCEDATNSDQARLRAAIRSRVTPVLKELSSRVVQRAGTTAEILREAADCIAARAGAVLDEGRSSDGLRWPRARLRTLEPAILGELLRQGAARLRAGRGLDRLGHGAIRRVRDAVLDRAGGERRFSLGGIRIVIRADEVQLQPEIS